MNTLIQDQYFLQDQLKEIRRYISRHRGENPNLVVMKWIEEHAADYRRHWDELHITM